MAQLGKADLEHMTDDYLQSLGPEPLVAVAKNLRALAVEPLAKLEESSKTSFCPPSLDHPSQSTPRPEIEPSMAIEASIALNDLELLARGLSEEALVESIRLAGFDCCPVVEALIEALQTAESLHGDETLVVRIGTTVLAGGVLPLP